MKINLIDFILGKFKSLKNDIKLLEKNKANNIDLEQLRGYNISSYEFLIAEGYPLELATYKENVEDGANFNKRYINIDKDISKVTVNTDIVISFIYEKNGEKKIYQKFGKYSTDKFIDTVQLPFIEGNPSIQISLYKNKEYNKNFEQIDSNKCSVLLNYGKKEADIIDEIDEVCFRISIRDRNVLTKDNTQEYTPTADYEPATKKYVDDNAVIQPLPVHTIQENDTTIAKIVNIMDLIPGVQYSTYKDINQTKTEGYRIVYICDDGTFRLICNLPLKNKVIHLLKVVHSTKDNYSTLSYNNIAYNVDYSKHSTNTDVEVTKTLQYYLPLNNTIEYNPTKDYHPATKKYADDKFICTDIVDNVGTISKEEMQKCNNGTSRYVSSIKFEEFFADYEHCVYQGTYGDKNIYMKYDAQYNRMIAYDLSDIIMLGFNFDTHYMYPFNAGADEVKSYQFTNDLVITKSPILNPSKVLTKDNTQEYTPTNDYNPATKKYVDDNKEYINYNDKLINNKITALHISRNPVSCSTEINKKPLCELFPELLNMTYDTVFKKSISFKVNMDNFTKEYPTVKSAYNKIGVNLYDENGNSIGNGYGSYINGDGLNIVYINTTQSIRFSAYFDKALVEGSNTSMETKNGYMTIQLSIPKGDNKKEFIDKIKNLKLSITVVKTDFLNLNNESIYTPTNDYNPATKKYVDDKVASSPQLSFNETGELVVTINGVSKTFVPKG